MASSERPRDSERNAVLSGLLAVLSLLAGIGITVLGVIAAPIATIAVGALVVYRLKLFGEDTPPFPRPRFSLSWLREFARFLVDFLVWAAPKVPFVAPFLVFVAVTWPLARESKSLLFQEQASQILLVLLIGYAIEVGAIRWRGRPVNWILSLMTLALLLVGEVYALVDLATENPDHADIIAGSMAAGVTAILIAAIQGSVEASKDEQGDGSD
ncbi:MAG TPA: hypothetical protein VLL27_02645 [Solirubrobacterales bacterium]|nr:hypothetical protein [Solirubrobacterales bacterium]